MTPRQRARELATTLAALRWYQAATPEAERAGGIHYAEGIEPLTDAEIDALCERINGLAVRR